MSSKLAGIPVSPGLCIGRAVCARATDTHDAGRRIDQVEVESEIARFKDAVRKACGELQAIQSTTSARASECESAIFQAQLLMLQDPTVRESVESRIRCDLVSAEAACLMVCEENAQMLQTLDDEYLAARAQDVRDISQRLVSCLTGRSAGLLPTALPENPVIIADDLSPSDAACLDPSQVSAVVLDRGGPTSHAAILVRALGIPAVMATGAATEMATDGDVVLVDGGSGDVTLNPDDDERAGFEVRVEAAREEKRRLELLRDLPAVMADGRRLRLVANIGGPGDIKMVKAAGAEGIGLFRTEFLFIDRTSAPDEEEQLEAYRQVLCEMAPHPVVVRTLDAGGDKCIPYLAIPDEPNPFLGIRAVRLCFREEELFRTQLRALLRASIYGDLRIMLPMVANIEELRAAKRILEDVRHELLTVETAVADEIPVGIMIEIPSAAVAADILAKECDFFSIGTNDLVQYTMACDRGNPHVGYLNDPFSPAVLRLIASVIRAGRDARIGVGMCGEMAGMPIAIPLLAGMGMDELSMVPSSLPRAKDIVRNLDSRSAASVWKRVEHMITGSEIRSYLEGTLTAF